ncbi:sugar transporter [Streptomyces sulfonofaciens]|uniref:Sugar transporter n=1 Tax=Streptomyces sulfonofaciens TaxID=68272 RepID=A0A919GKY8_9ACTN|nr:MFS transporter [Streptomyces sulfonofaciens]GHH85923.1 sugar transporter [Streptomyces sulfonofaciens]
MQALSAALVRLLALTCGITVANVYYAQPLLNTIAHELGTSRSAAGILVTATQVGFAVGLVFVVPLGDIIARRPLISALLAVNAVALAASAVAPGLRVLSALAVLIGVSSVVVQMVIPYAATLARAEQRGRTIGTLMGAVLLGILLSRTFAGLVAGAAGWRCVYAVAAGLMAVLAVVVSRVLPAGGREVEIGYLGQMRAVLRLVRSEPVLRWRSLIGAAQFATFSCFWSTVTFQLAGPPFGYGQAEIGLFALVGALGAGCVLAGGRLLDRWRRLRWPVTGAGIALLLGSFGVLAAGAHSLAWLVVGALVMDACCQIVHVTNQAVIYDLVDAARSRIATVYMTTYFVGGALGTSVGVAAYDRYGWAGACTVSAALCGIALLGWLAAHRHERPGLTAPPAAGLAPSREG